MCCEGEGVVSALRVEVTSVVWIRVWLVCCVGKSVVCECGEGESERVRVLCG